MLPHSERFKDSRKDRAQNNPAARMPGARAKRKALSRATSKEWKALREDKRFALPILVAMIRKHGFRPHVSLSHDKWIKPLHTKDWPSCDQIPNDLWMFCAAHPAKSDKQKIACYPTRADALREREIVMQPGRFFRAALPDATNAEIQGLTEAYTNAMQPFTYETTRDADTWARVYSSQRGFGSCMDGRHFSEANHPCRFYVHPENNLALAYMRASDGETIARCIINTKNMCYVRVYGDARLELALESNGFNHNSHKALNGQTCNAKTNKYGELIAPYLDAIQRISWDGHSNYCIIDPNGEYEAGETSGIASGGNREQCEACGDYRNIEDMNFSEYHEINICEYCAQHDFTYAIFDRHGHSCLIRDDETITMGNGTFLNDHDVLSAHGFVRDYDGEWQDLDDCVYLKYLSEYVLCDECTRLDIAHGEDDYARDCDTKTITLDGKELTVHEDYSGPEDETEDEKRARLVAAAINSRKLRRAQRGR